jgi:hypothetical protein
MVSGCVGLLPLLFTPQGSTCQMIHTNSSENVLKISYMILFFTALYPYLGRAGIIERLYYLGLCSIVAVEEFAPLIAYTGRDQGILKKYEFLPLMGVSVACAVGVVWGWMRFLRIMIME